MITNFTQSLRTSTEEMRCTMYSYFKSEEVGRRERISEEIIIHLSARVLLIMISSGNDDGLHE